MSRPYPDSAARQYPPSTTPDRRKITKCSDPKAWYAGMIGQIITVHYFCSFGAWDTQGRRLYYYDLSADLSEPTTVSIKNSENKKAWFKKLFK